MEGRCERAVGLAGVARLVHCRFGHKGAFAGGAARLEAPRPALVKRKHVRAW